MKKQILLSAFLISLSLAANAAESTFKTRAESNAERRALDAAADQRDIEQLKASQDILAELQKSNTVSAEISTKLDKLIESSDANNLLMQTLLQRTE